MHKWSYYTSCALARRVYFHRNNTLKFLSMKSWLLPQQLSCVLYWIFFICVYGQVLYLWYVLYFFHWTLVNLKNFLLHLDILVHDFSFFNSSLKPDIYWFHKWQDNLQFSCEFTFYLSWVYWANGDQNTKCHHWAK